jgi:hypothetical protein
VEGVSRGPPQSSTIPQQTSIFSPQACSTSEYGSQDPEFNRPDYSSADYQALAPMHRHRLVFSNSTPDQSDGMQNEEIGTQPVYGDEGPLVLGGLGALEPSFVPDFGNSAIYWNDMF